jgi:hypothetical protein
VARRRRRLPTDNQQSSNRIHAIEKAKRPYRYLHYNIYVPKPSKRPYTLKVDIELLDALRAIKDRDGVNESEQIRRGIRLWLKAKRVAPGAARKRAKR